MTNKGNIRSEQELMRYYIKNYKYILDINVEAKKSMAAALRWKINKNHCGCDQASYHLFLFTTISTSWGCF